MPRPRAGFPLVQSLVVPHIYRNQLLADLFSPLAGLIANCRVGLRIHNRRKEGLSKGVWFMKCRMLFVLLVCALAFSLSPALYGQANGSFSGTVLDKSGSAIAGATVTATSQGTGVSRQAKTDEAGHYLIPLLPVSIYTLRVEFQGFSNRRKQGPPPAGR